MTNAKLMKEIQAVKAQHGRYTEYAYTTDIDDCNDHITTVNLNFYKAELTEDGKHEYVACIEYADFFWENDEEEQKALAKAEKAEAKLKKFIEENLK